MRPSLPFVLSVAGSLLYATAVGAGPSSLLDSLHRPDDGEVRLLPRNPDGDHHDHHTAPLMQYNETLQLLTHSPTPPSYFSVDFDHSDSSEQHYPGLMGLHVLLMTVAFFVALPMGIALRSVRSSWHGVSVFAFWSLCVLGCAASALYRKFTPNMYDEEKHGTAGYIILLVALSLSTLDIVALVSRIAVFVRNGEQFSLRPFWHNVVLGQNSAFPTGFSHEYASLVVGADDAELKSAEQDESEVPVEPIHVRRSRPLPNMRTHSLDERQTSMDRWRNTVHWPASASSARTVFGLHLPNDSHHSDDTLHDLVVSHRNNEPLLHRIGRGVFASTERALVFAGYAQLLSGIAVYTGGCRGNYLNGCLAHLIKGGIFWCYGLVTFARFLGSFSDLGWAWNFPPSTQLVSAEFTESFVVFLYGVTNTWMERFGAHAGDPYTTKQVQHISIAIMFWFGGLVSMAIESRSVRRWLASTAAAAVGKTSRTSVEEPPSYMASFNPFPALVIGVTGVAMSAHAQTYMFQVQIHALWGFLLGGFALLRFLTYFFLWVAPPRSVLPSRPPTEALASFFLACGGLMFILSDEEITIAAMRVGHDDQMMFLNLAVAITCLAFFWTLGVVAFKGWLKSHIYSMSFHDSA